MEVRHADENLKQAEAELEDEKFEQAQKAEREELASKYKETERNIEETEIKVAKEI